MLSSRAETGLGMSNFASTCKHNETKRECKKVQAYLSACNHSWTALLLVVVYPQLFAGLFSMQRAPWEACGMGTALERTLNIECQCPEAYGP